MHFKTSITLLLILSLFGCVSQKKYNDLTAAKDRVVRDNLRLQQVEQDHEALKLDMDSTLERLQKTESVLMDLKDKYLGLQNSHTDLQVRYDQLLEENQTLLISASDEKESLTMQLSDKQIELDEKERLLRRLEDQLNQKETDLNSLQEEISAREKKINELNSELNNQNEQLSGLKSKLNQALLGFSDTDLTVVQKNGKIYVSMSQNLLFAKNSKLIDKKGKEAITRLSEVLSNNPDIDITVEGHTDSDGDVNFNWDLSVTRATAVVKELSNNGIDAKRITASGRGLFFPVDTNETEEGKSRNRRTEIILSPKLDELYRLINQ
jgi:chemotaxis protein MotB